MSSPTPTRGGELAVTIGGATYMVEPENSMEQYDPKYQDLDLATGDRFNTVDVYASGSECKASISIPLNDGMGALLPILGLQTTNVATTAKVGVPTETTIVYALPTRTVTVTNATANDISVTWANGKPTMVAVNFFSTAIPVRTAGYSTTPPAMTAVNYFYWRDLLSLFTAASTGLIGIQEFVMKLDHQLFAFPGVRTDGLALPTSYTATQAKVTGSIKKLITDAADYDSFLAACQVPGDWGLTASPFCVSTSPKLLTQTIKNAIIDTQKREGTTKQASLENFTWRTKNVRTAPNPLIFTMV